MNVISVADIFIPGESLSTMAGKYEALQRIVRSMRRVAVAYSGGVDSTFILRAARDALGDGVVALTALSPSFPSADMEATQAVAREMGVKHVLLETHEVDDPRYLENDGARCYYCKTEMYSVLAQYARAQDYEYLVDGMNQDDLTDRRPGRQAAVEMGVRSPLAEAHLTKSEIRVLSRELRLPTWNKPAMACLSSRVPTGTPITHAALAQIDAAETFLRRLGLRQVRVRHHEAIARLEVEAEDFAQVVAQRTEIVAQLQSLGYAFVALDLQGYRTGSLHALDNRR